MKLPIWGKVAPAVSHAPPGSDFSVALVLPPYGSALVANLALALLSAGIKARGVPCRCFYWNLDVMEALDAPDPLQRVARYERLADRPARPFNEWAFARPLYDGEMRERDQDTWKLLQQCLVRRQEGDESAGFVDDVIRLRERAPELIAAMVERLQSFSLVGISSTFFSNIPALALARAIKRRWPQKIVVLGGANCDGEMGRALMEKFPQLDYAFSGEVDQAFPEFVARLSRGDPIDETPDMHRRLADGQIISGPPARPTEALDELPLPDYDDYVRERQRVGLEALPRILALEASRGCWWARASTAPFAASMPMVWPIGRSAPSDSRRRSPPSSRSTGRAACSWPTTSCPWTTTAASWTGRGARIWR